MASKYKIIYESLNEEIAALYSSRERWMEFLKTAAHNYKYSFNDQVLIFNQRPDATACASFEEWNRLVGRWVNKGASGIALIDSTGSYNRLRYVFDVSDTHSKYNKAPIWNIRDEYHNEVIASLENAFGELAEKDNLKTAIKSAVNNMVDDNIVDYIAAVKNDLTGTYLETCEDDVLTEILSFGIKNSVAYMMCKRCGLDVDEYSVNDFQTVLYLNSNGLMDVFGTAVSDISEMGLREIEKTAKYLNRTFELKNRTEYTKDEKSNERSHSDGRDNLQQTRRISDSGPDLTGREQQNTSREVRNDEKNISSESQSYSVEQTSENGRIDESSSFDRRDGNEDSRTDGSGAGSAELSERADEEREPDALGTDDEFLQGSGGGNSDEGTDSRIIPEFPTVEEQQNIIEEAEAEKTSAFSISQEDIDAVLTRGSGVYNGKFRIYEQYLKMESHAKNAEFLKDEYGWGGAFPAVRDRNIDESHDANGIKISIGSLLNPDDTIHLKWTQVEKRIGELISADRYLSEKEIEQYPKYKEEREIEKKRSEIATEYQSIIRDFNDYMDSLGEDTKKLNTYVYLDCGTQFTRGSKTTSTLSDNNFIIPLMQGAMERIPNEAPHLQERCDSILTALKSDVALPLYPDAEDLAPKPEVKKEYVFSLGDTVYIGINEYEILSIDTDEVRLYDKEFPLINKYMPKDEFDRKIEENPYNDRYLQIIDKKPAVADNSEYVYDINDGRFPLDYKHDLFYDRGGSYAMLFFNSDSFSGGQYVECILQYEDILEARDNSNGDVNEFFIQLEQLSSQYIYDVGTDEWNEFVKEYADQPGNLIWTRDENDEELMDGLVAEAEAALNLEKSRPSYTAEQWKVISSVDKYFKENYPENSIFRSNTLPDENGIINLGSGDVGMDENGYGLPYNIELDISRLKVALYAGDKIVREIQYSDFAELQDNLQELNLEDMKKEIKRTHYLPQLQEAINKYLNSNFEEDYDVEIDADTQISLGYSTDGNDKDISVMLNVGNDRFDFYYEGKQLSIIQCRDIEDVIKTLDSETFESLIGFAENEIEKQNGIDIHSLSVRMQEFLKDYDYYNYADSMEVGESDVDVIARIENDLTVPDNVLAMYKWFCDTEFSTEEESVVANDIAEELHSVYISQQKKLLIGKEVIIDESPFRIESISEIGDDVSMLDVNARYPISRVEKLSFVLEKLAETEKSNLPIGRIDYLHSDGTVIESTEYTSEDQFKKDIKEELYYGTPISIVLYRDENGKTVKFDSFGEEIDTLPNGFEIIEAPYLENEEKPGLSPVIPKLSETENNDIEFVEKLEAPDTRKVQKLPPTVIHPEIKSDYRSNFRITEDDIGEGTKLERTYNNITAIRLLKKLEAENRLADPTEQLFLSEYVGWGGLPGVFEENDSHYSELKSLLTEEEYSAARESTLTAFYTPPIVIKAIYKAIENAGFTKGNILEPSCGIGNFMGLLPESMKQSKMYGVELDSISGRIAQQLYQNNSIAVNGYEETNLPDSFFDLAIGNVPFGQFKVPDKRYDKNNWLIHDYFFGKTLDKVRPGGIIAFVTSKGTLDKENPAVRKYIAQRADLLGAIRLPNNTFKSAAGTEVTSDIIFLQKRDRLVNEEPDWVYLDTDENGIKMNKYFIDNPDMVCGEMKMITGPYGPESACVPYEDESLEDLLSNAVQNVHANISDFEIDEIDDVSDADIPADPTVRNFSYTVVNGDVYYRENSVMHRVDAAQTQLNRIKGMITIRDTVRKLIEYQTEDYPEGDIENAQLRLNAVYDEFTKKYGLINSRANNTAFSSDNSYFLLSSLENLDEQGNLKSKADMFTKRTIRPKTVVEKVDTSSEALILSLSEKAKVDMEYMKELTGKDANEIMEDLRGVVFLNPERYFGLQGEEYLAADEYLSGNVREKLRYAEQCAGTHPELFSENVKALEKVQPVDLSASDISVRLGATWIPADIVEEFMFDLMKTPRYAQWNIHVRFMEYTGEWNIEGKSYDRYNITASNTYGTDRINGYKILEETLNLHDVRIFDYIDDGSGNRKPVLNRKETALAQGKQELIKQAFQEWVWADPVRRDNLTKLYNEKFNSIRPREYDGDHLSFSGMNPEIKLRKHQVDAIAHIIYGGNTLLAHQVGAGKTYEMVAAAQESKRLGLCNKSLFVVPNHIIEQFASEYLQLYPSANILVATKKDFETKNRKKFCGRIATGDYDAVIIGHSQFEKIPMSLDRQRNILQQQLDEIMDGIAELKRTRGNNFSIKQFEKTKKQIVSKLDKLNDQTRKDDVVTFEELGVDRLFVDEAHGFKNLAAFTKMRNVGGISQTEAQKSSDLYMKCRYMDELTGGRGIVFATGTPISNSMVEMYTMQKYLQYATLKEHNLIHFDSWASTFGECVTAIELDPSGSGYRSKTRFSKFYNLPELMNMFKQVADVQTSDMLKLPVPEAEYHNVALKASEHQKLILDELSERAEKVHNKMVDSSKDNMLVITNDGRKLALDQRIINPLLPDYEGSKVNACAENVFNIWRDTAEQSSAQMVFCDMSTPKGNGEFNIYDDLRDKLVLKGIPKDQITFIHEAKTETQKQDMFNKVRTGQIRVIIGSTDKMGAGTNAQNKLIALHHLDIGWRPSDIQQREGRIIRQGNENSKVHIYTYVTEGTFDAYMWQLVESKQKFIGQIMTSKSPVRSADDVDETALSYAEIKALCAGDDRIKEKMTLDTDVAKLKLMKASHLSQKYTLEDKILKEFPQKIASLEQRIKGLEKDIETVSKYPSPEEGILPMVLGDRTFTTKQDAGAKILAFCKAMTNPEPKEIGSYRGFRMELSFDGYSREYNITMVGNIRHTVALGTDTVGNIQRIENCLAGFGKKLDTCREQFENTETQLENAKLEVEKPFPQEEELKTKSARLAELNAVLNLDKTENEIVDSEKAEDVQEREPREQSEEVR